MIIIKINRQHQTEIATFLQGGYSIDSICKVMSKKYKGTDFKKSDVLILARQMGLKNIGTKDLSKQKIDLKTAKKALPLIMKDKNLVNSIKTKLLFVLIIFVTLLGTSFYFGGVKPMLFTALGGVGIVGLAILFLYFKYFKIGKG